MCNRLRWAGGRDTRQRGQRGLPGGRNARCGVSKLPAGGMPRSRAGRAVQALRRRSSGRQT
eukprot:5814060-Lingulodinium_polyedra.AAC.1